MPELPEVETVCRGLAKVLIGRRMTEVEVRRAGLRIPFPENFAARLTGRRIEAISRRAKYLLIDFDDGAVLIGHLGMSGRLYLGQGPWPAAGTHDHVRAKLDDGGWFAYHDPRRFGLMTLDHRDSVADHPLLKDLGPEPLGNDFDAVRLAAALSERRGPIKTVLLDQTVVSGLGNIYVCEALHRAAIAPTRPALSLTAAEIDRLVPAIRAVLTEAIAAGGSSLRDYVQANGELGYFQSRFLVYDREGTPCPSCGGGPVGRIVQANRSTFFCPDCQK